MLDRATEGELLGLRGASIRTLRILVGTRYPFGQCEASKATTEDHAAAKESRPCARKACLAESCEAHEPRLLGCGVMRGFHGQSAQKRGATT